MYITIFLYFHFAKNKIKYNKNKNGGWAREELLKSFKAASSGMKER
jgi:predicted glycosyltransferase involved in capsule biosynthesis